MRETLQVLLIVLLSCPYLSAQKENSGRPGRPACRTVFSAGPQLGRAGVTAVLCQAPQTAPAHPPAPTWQLSLLAGRKNFAEGDYATAETKFVEALRQAESVGVETAGVSACLDSLAGLLQHQGRLAEAKPLYLRSLAISEKTAGAGGLSLAQALNNLGTLLYAQGDYSRAEELYKRSLAIEEKTPLADGSDLSTHLNNLAAAYDAQSKYAEAEPLYRRSLAIEEGAYGPESPDLAPHLNNLALLYIHQGKYAKAGPFAERAFDIQEHTFGPDHPNLPWPWLASNTPRGTGEVSRPQSRIAETHWG